MNWNMQAVTTTETWHTKVKGEPKTIVTAELKHVL